MNNKMNPTIEQIKSIEDKYGVMLFSMGLTQLIEVGTRALINEKSVGNMLCKIKGSIPDNAIMSADFQCNIIRCAAELARFSPMSLMRYVKKHMTIND